MCAISLHTHHTHTNACPPGLFDEGDDLFGGAPAPKVKPVEKKPAAKAAANPVGGGGEDLFGGGGGGGLFDDDDDLFSGGAKGARNTFLTPSFRLL